MSRMYTMVVFLIASLLSACGSSINFKRVNVTPYDGPQKNILVIYAMGYPPPTVIMPALAKALDACGASAKQVNVPYHFDSFNPPDPDQILAEGIKMSDGFRFDTIMEFVERTHYNDPSTGTRAATFYSLRYLDRQRTPLWTSSSEFFRNHGGYYEMGEVFSRGIVERLTQDKIFRNCTTK